MNFASALSTNESLDAAIAEVCGTVAPRLGGACDLAAIFVSADWAGDSQRIANEVSGRLGVTCLLGCTAESVLGVGREIEAQTAMSLWAARLPGVELLPMHLSFERSPEGGAIVGWPEALEGDWPPDATLLMLGEPFSFPTDALLQRLNEDHPGVPVVGGMASGASSPGRNRLMLGRDLFKEGAVAALVHGPLRVRTVVSQGCRPIGKPFVVTKAERNIIYELGGRAALLQLKEIFDALPTREQQLVQHGLHVGRVVSEYRDHFEQGDFLIRNVMGIDGNEGSVVVSDYVRVGQTVQFQIRDDQTADHELRQLLGRVAGDDNSPGGALMFTCNGRGTRLFGTPHHDALAVRNALGEIPLAGFFAAGEIGPVGGQNFVHGFTASLALFEPRLPTA